MIKTVSDFLNKLREKENNALKNQNITHRPTIGDMYEGLTSNLLSKSFPEQYCIDIVSGFISDDSGNLSNELDCIVATGKGIPVPYTQKRKFSIDEVIAVVQVKKNLYSNDLKSGFENLQSLNRFNSTSDIAYELFQDAFQGITRRPVPDIDKVSSLPYEIQLIYATLIMDLRRPVRIILGYNGFVSEAKLRDSFFDFLNRQVEAGLTRGFGVSSFPTLIVCGNYSLAKANGMPYLFPMTKDGFWPFYFSTSHNPIEIMLNLIWTRLVYSNLLHSSVFDEDMTLNRFTRFIEAKGVCKKNMKGWEYRPLYAPEDNLKNMNTDKPWEPTKLDFPQFVIVNLLCKEGELDIDDPLLEAFLSKHGYTPNSLFKSLNKLGLVGLDDHKLVLLTRGCAAAVLPDGSFVAAENISGQLYRWISDYYGRENS